MKVLFAVHDEKVSLSIVKKYQKEYKEIISYKNVYYFNAILKELQRDKSYDRIIIDEELEEFTSSSYEQKDKFIFDKLDNITDEASNSTGNDIPIILICSERRAKSEDILVKLFGIGIYNAIIGNDRSTDEVCRLIKKPRSKKEAKLYYKIDVDDVKYQHENEDDVSEEEMQYILSYFSRLGKNEEKYVESFKNIVSQYNEKQMRVIISILPLHVRSVLEESSPEYQRLVATGGRTSSTKISGLRTIKNMGTSEKLLSGKDISLKKPIVVPSKLDNNVIKKITIKKPSFEEKEPIEEEDYDEDDDFEDDEIENNEFVDIKTKVNDVIDNMTSDLDDDEYEDTDDGERRLPEIEENEIEVNEPAPRKRGRPRKNPVVDENQLSKVPRKRGRPRKNPIVEELVEDENVNQYDEDFEEVNSLPGFESVEDDNSDIEINQDFYEENQEESNFYDDNEEKTFEEADEETDDDYIDEEDEGFNKYKDDNIEYSDEDEDNEDVLPGFEKVDDDDEDEYESESDSNEGFDPNSLIDDDDEFDQLRSRNDNKDYELEDKLFNKNSLPENVDNYEYDFTEYNNLISSNRKVIAFVGTSKNGTSFIVNNIAKILSDNGVDTAILDATKNQNAYYIYTDNDEELRLVATHGIRRLSKGMAEGVKVKNNLTVYTELPGNESNLQFVGQILETLVKNHSAVLIDCDFNTPLQYFDKAQEIYLVQSLDVLTIQPLTAFLRELKTKKMLNDTKLRIILNKMVKVKGANAKIILGGMSKYNDPEMNFMTDLFDVNSVVPIMIPFYQEVYENYLSQLIECKVTTNSYPKDFQQILNNLASMVFPLLPAKGKKNKKGYNYDVNTSNYANNGFSNSVNNTLNDMKKRY